MPLVCRGRCVRWCGCILWACGSFRFQGISSDLTPLSVARKPSSHCALHFLLSHAISCLLQASITDRFRPPFTTGSITLLLSKPADILSASAKDSKRPHRRALATCFPTHLLVTSQTPHPAQLAPPKKIFIPARGCSPDIYNHPRLFGSRSQPPRPAHCSYATAKVFHADKAVDGGYAVRSFLTLECIHQSRWIQWEERRARGEEAERTEREEGRNGSEIAFAESIGAV